MQKLIYSIAAIGLVATAVFVWSHTALVPIHASTASVAGLPAEATSLQGTASISPTEITVTYKGELPAQQWEPH